MAVKKDPRMAAPLDSTGPGAYLRDAREQANMTVEKVATALRLQTAIVEALEADAYDRLPAPTFVRGYLLGYARVLGLPSGPVVEMYDRQGFEPPPLTTEVNESTQAHTSDTAVRVVTYAVAVALALLVGLWWHSQENGGFGIVGDLFERSPDAAEDPSLPATEESGTAPDDGDAEGGSLATASGPADEFARDGEFPAPAPGSDAEFGEFASDETATAGAEAEGESGTSPGTSLEDEASTANSTAGDAGEVATDEFEQAGAEAQGEVAATETTPAGAGAEGEVPAAGTTTAGADAADASASASLAAAPAPETAGAVPDAAANATADPSATADTGTGQSGLVLEFVHESWVEVHDGERTRLFFGLVQPGRVLTFDGPQPFDVLLGFGKDVRVAIDGQAFDLTPYLKHGVARFSVGASPGDDDAGAG